MKSHYRLTRSPVRGAALSAALLVAAGSASAATTYGLLYSFSANGLVNGAYPKSGLISDSARKGVQQRKIGPIRRPIKIAVGVGNQASQGKSSVAGITRKRV